MSGIFGIYYFDQQVVERADLMRMDEQLVHRGPNGAKSWCDGSIGFGHRMLWTTPESLHETLPLAREKLVITSDARIDNRKELITALGLEHVPAEKITDSQLILEAYEKWGNRCPEYL
jgi:asparagine synthase (glutamine-hydrolysing)